MTALRAPTPFRPVFALFSEKQEVKLVRVILLAGGGHASDVLGAIEAHNRFDKTNEPIHVVGILDDNAIDEERFVGRNVKAIGTTADVQDVEATHFISCAGFPAGRQHLAKLAEAAGLKALSVVHPKAWVPEGIVIEGGSVILAGCCISPGATIGRHVYLSHGSLIGHDTHIGDYASVMPRVNVCGDVIVSEGVILGASSTVLQGLNIGAGATLGAGALAVSDIPEKVVAKGLPAKW